MSVLARKPGGDMSGCELVVARLMCSRHDEALLQPVLPRVECGRERLAVRNQSKRKDTD